MNYATIATLLIFFLYTGLSWRILGPLESVSQTWYLWKDRGYSAAFNWFGFLVCIACVFQSTYDHELLTTVFFILSGSCMWFLTIASPYKVYNSYHIVPTLAAIAFGYAAVWAEFGFSWVFWVSLGAGAVGSLLMMKLPYRTTCQELWTMSCILTPFVR